MAAEWATPEALAFIVRHGSGIVCVVDGGASASSSCELPAPDRARHRGDGHRVHADGRRAPRHDDRRLGRRPGTHHPGADRARHRRPTTCAAPATSSRCAASRGGVLERAGHTEAAARPRPPRRPLPRGRAVRGRERRRHDGAARPTSSAFAAEHDLPLVSVAELIAYRVPRASARRSAGRARGSRPPRRLRRDRATARTTAARTSRSCAATSRARARRARARALGVLHRRRPRQPPLRLRRAARPRARADRGRGRRRRRLHPRARATAHRSAALARVACARRSARATRSRRTPRSASPTTSATTASARRSWPTSASRGCAC